MRELLIIGAGPYGLALALQAQRASIDYCLVGSVMTMWKQQMPSGMRLRTCCDWSTEDQLNAYLAQRGLDPQAITPLPVEFFTDFVDWTIEQHNLARIDATVERLCYQEGHYQAELSNGTFIDAAKVVIASGFYSYRYIPEAFHTMLPTGCYAHSADCADLEQMTGKRVLIIGGRQSAFEWAGLSARYAAAVDLVYRHETPIFKLSDWSWVEPFIARIAQQPGWFRQLPEEEKAAINRRFWQEGRGELEAWLQPGLASDNVHCHANSTVIGCDQNQAGELLVSLSGGEQISCDQIILATGYQVDINRRALLDRRTITARLEQESGSPKLDDYLQSTLPGLYFTGIHAVHDHGPFFFFVAAAEAAAQLIINSVE